MADNLRWTPEAWSAAIAALPSVSELLALYNGGAVSCVEVCSAVWEYCHDKPEVAASLVQVFRNHHDEHIRNIVGKGLEDLFQARYGDLA